MRNPAADLFLAGLLLLVSCAAPGTEPSDGGPEEPVPPVEELVGNWALEELHGLPLDTARPGRAPGLRVDADGRLSGFSGVNRFTGGLDVAALAEGRFVTGPLVSTRMAGPAEAMDLERRYLEALGRPSSVRIVRDALVLVEDGKVLARFLPER